MGQAVLTVTTAQMGSDANMAACSLWYQVLKTGFALDSQPHGLYICGCVWRVGIWGAAALGTIKHTVEVPSEKNLKGRGHQGGRHAVRLSRERGAAS